MCFFHIQPIPFFQDVIYFTMLPFFSQIEKARCALTQRASCISLYSFRG
ncbi:hypothetical protein CHCC14821_1526 [Bacillus paralicheniformis]|nr:hypothetical protein CHCC14821_1526 [Bacillus paralicheniformis]